MCSGKIAQVWQAPLSQALNPIILGKVIKIKRQNYSCTFRSLLCQKVTVSPFVHWSNAHSKLTNNSCTKTDFFFMPCVNFPGLSRAWEAEHATYSLSITRETSMFRKYAWMCMPRQILIKEASAFLSDCLHTAIRFYSRLYIAHAASQVQESIGKIYTRHNKIHIIFHGP